MALKNKFILLSACLFSLVLFLLPSSQTSMAQDGSSDFQKSRSVIQAPDSGSKSNYTPGFAFGGIPFDDSEFYEIKPEKCEAESTAEIVGKYELTEDLYLFKTEKGFGVASLEQTLRELNTGQRRKKLCPRNIGLSLQGEIDCKGVRVIKESPFEGCAYEAKIWGHSMTEFEAFNLIYGKLAKQFKAYKKECIVPVKRTLKDRMIKF